MYNPYNPYYQQPQINYYYNNQNNQPTYVKEAFIDNVTEEEDINIGFDLSLLKREELLVNLIHFDLNITNRENYMYYNKFKVDVVGGYIAVDNLDMLIHYLEAMKYKNIPFIVLTSGFSGKDVIPICQKYQFIKEVIIFCGNYGKYKHYLKQYPGYVKNIFIDIRSIYNYIKAFGLKYDAGTKDFKKSGHFIFSPEDIQMNKQLEQCPVISAYEYDNCYFLIHKAYSHFFKKDDKKKVIFTNSYFNKIQDYICKSQLIEDRFKNDLIQQFKSLVDKPNFLELSLRQYTGESNFCYIFNRTMRNFEKGLISLAYYMGPFLYAANRYVKENPTLGFRQNMVLHRNIICSEFDFYSYKLNLGHIICFPSITSTSLVPKEFGPSEQNNNNNNNSAQFQPSAQGQYINKHNQNSKNLLKVKMIFNYRHIPGVISPGIIIANNRGKDNLPLSKYPNENEVILFPFTFARINNIMKAPQREDQFVIYLDIIGRKDYIELILKDNVENRYKFSDLDRQINKY